MIKTTQHRKHGVRILLGGFMGVVELKPGQSVVAALNYVDKDGNLLGPVPVADGPSFSIDNPGLTSLSKNADGTVTVSNVNAAVTANATLNGSAKGFTDKAVITYL